MVRQNVQAIKNGYEWGLHSVGTYHEATEENQQHQRVFICLLMQRNENNCEIVKDAYFHLA